MPEQIEWRMYMSNDNELEDDQVIENGTENSQKRSLDALVQKKYIGCLVGGAVGDALGAPVEFMSAASIRSRFGASGIQEYVPAFGKLGAITDDTQMTLFTAEGLLRSRFSEHKPSLGELRVYIAKAYQRWLHTHGYKHELQADICNGWLLDHEELFSCRAPGNTCLSGLQSMRKASDIASNSSKGCGGVMRVAPIGMYFASLSRHHKGQHPRFLLEAFELGCQAAAITHGHPTGQLSSGVFAAIIMELLCGKNLPVAIDAVMPVLNKYASCDETVKAVATARRLAATQPNESTVLHKLGEGWVAEEALAIALYCALSATDFRSGVELSVNHSGDSDSTGSMTGQLLGAIHGHEAIPATWLESLELITVISSIADDLTLSDWTAAEIEATAIGPKPQGLNTLTETAALRAYAVMVNTLTVDGLEPLLADDFAHESQRNFDAYKSKEDFLSFVTKLHQALLDSGETAYAEMGRVWCSTSIMCSSSIEAAESMAEMQMETRSGNIRPCVILAYGDKDTPEVVVLAEIESNKLKRIDICVIPGVELAQRSGEYPK
jgi:ADP-ribosyl-[dinitrogen reductase] hydrolase